MTLCSSAANRLVDDDIPFGDRQKRRELSQQRRPTEQARKHVRIASRASLHRAIGIQDARSDDRALRMCIENRTKRAGGARHEPAVRIHDEHVGSAGRREPLIDRARETDIRAIAREPHVRRERVHRRAASVDRCVVDDDAFPRVVRQVVGNRPECSLELGAGVVVDDNRRDLGRAHRTPRASRVSKRSSRSFMASHRVSSSGSIADAATRRVR